MINCDWIDNTMYRIAGLFPQVQIFPNGEPLALAEEFSRFRNSWSKHSGKTHMSDTL